MGQKAEILYICVGRSPKMLLIWVCKPPKTSKFALFLGRFDSKPNKNQNSCAFLTYCMQILL